MIARLAAHIRQRWHPLWHLRRHPLFHRFQERFDFTVFRKLEDAGMPVALRFLRDASWVADASPTDPAVRAAFRLLLPLLEPAVFWDIGANIGYYSWVVRRHPSVRKVLMFEPDPVNFGLLGRTIARNALTDCEPLNVALSDRTGHARFFIDRASGATGSLQLTAEENPWSLHHAYGMAETIACRTVTIDDLVAQGTPVPQLIKIDVEGVEALVIAGARRTLTEHHPALIVETSDPDFFRLLGALGYTAFRIDAGNVLFFPSASPLDTTTLSAAFRKIEELPGQAGSLA